MPTPEELLEALETRLILGEISETRYDELKAKLLAKLDGGGGTAASGETNVSDSVIKGDVSSTTGAASVGNVVFNVAGPDVPPQRGAEVVECPLCGRRNEFKETFRCLKCGRDHLCLEHLAVSERMCEDCAGIGPDSETALGRASGDGEEEQELRARIDFDSQECSRAVVGGKGAAEYLRSAQRSGLDSWKRGAELGWPRAQWLYAKCLEVGTDPVRDATEAARWYLKAAENGYVAAQYSLGRLYASGKGVSKDEAEAARWFRKAAEQGFSAAQHALGLSYASGTGVSKDEAEAVRWYRKAAERGYASSQNNLGLSYANGSGVPEDETVAVDWYRRAAEKGLAIAQRNLALCYQHGHGVPKDAAEATKWFRKAAAQGKR